MNAALLIAAMLQPAPPVADRDTVNVVASVQRLRDMFVSAEFSGTQERTCNMPSGAHYDEMCKFVCRTCPDAIVVHTNTSIRNQRDANGRPLADFLSATERRWLRGEPRWQLNLAETNPAWPGSAFQAEDPGEPRLDAIVVHVDHPRGDHLVWEQLIVGDLVGSLDGATGIELSHIVAEQESLGFDLQKVSWTHADEADDVEYVFVSPEYGVAHFTFSLVDGEWMPTEIRLARESKHKLALSTLAKGNDNLIGNYRTFDDFTHPASGLDRLETVYRIAYNPLPTRIDRTNTQ